MGQQISNMRTAAFIACATGMMSWSCFASEITLSGTDLNGSGVTYSTVGSGWNGHVNSAAYVSTGPTTGYANLLTADGPNGDYATVTVQNGYEGVSLGTLSSLIAAGAAGDVSFNLIGVPIDSGQVPFWQVTLSDPNSGKTITLVTINAAPDEVSSPPLGSPKYILGPNYFNQGDSTQANNSPQLGNVAALWSVVAGYLDDGSQLGTWNVDSVGVEIGGWYTQAPMDAEIGSFTLPGDNTSAANSAPDAASTLPLLGIGLGALAGLRRRLHRARSC